MLAFLQNFFCLEGPRRESNIGSKKKEEESMPSAQTATKAMLQRQRTPVSMRNFKGIKASSGLQYFIVFDELGPCLLAMGCKETVVVMV